MKLVLIQIILLMTLSSQVAAQEPDLKGLEATHASVLEAVLSSDLKTIAQTIHPSAVGFFRQSQFPVKLGMQYDVRKALPSILESLSDLVSADPETEYQEFGGTGVVCETYEAQEIIKKKQLTVSRRSTYAYSKLRGRWYLVSWHDSTVVPQK